MARKLKELFKMAKGEGTIEESFLTDYILSTEKDIELNQIKPKQTYNPSSMICIRSMYYQATGVDPVFKKPNYSMTGITSSGSHRHQDIQDNILRMKKNGFDCEYIDVEDYIKEHNIAGLEVVERSGAETKLYSKTHNMRFMCDGILKYKGNYYLLEIKTETSNQFNIQKAPHEKHFKQVTAYATMLMLDKVLFLYENRDLCLLKCYLFQINDDMKSELIETLNTCNSYVNRGEVPPKPHNVPKNHCNSYCLYKKRCDSDG